MTAREPFETNWKLLRSRNRAAAEAADRAGGAESPLRAVATPSGHWTAVRQDPSGYRFIHSRIDPVREAQEWCRAQGSRERIRVVFGLGFGYHGSELLRSWSAVDSVHLIEADAALFRLALEYRDLSDILSSPVCHLHLGPAAGADLMDRIGGSFSYHLFLPALSLHAGYYRDRIRQVENRLYGQRARIVASEDGVFRPAAAERLLREMCRP